MRLHHNDTTLEIRVVGYQFPESPGDQWLNLELALEVGDESFRVVDACMETVELVWLLRCSRRSSGTRMRSSRGRFRTGGD